MVFRLLYRHTDNSVFDEFVKISDHFPKISKDSPKIVQRPHKCFQTISEDYQ